MVPWNQSKNKSLINLQMLIMDNDCVSNLENVEVNPQMEQVKSMLFTSIYQHVHWLPPTWPWYSNDLPQWTPKWSLIPQCLPLKVKNRQKITSLPYDPMNPLYTSITLNLQVWPPYWLLLIINDASNDIQLVRKKKVRLERTPHSLSTVRRSLPRNTYH